MAGIIFMTLIVPVNAPLLSSIIFKSHADQAFIEFVGARPGEGAVGAFAFGDREASSKASLLPQARRSASLHRPRGSAL
jgi:hypothetical protein